MLSIFYFYSEWLTSENPKYVYKFVADLLWENIWLSPNVTNIQIHDISGAYIMGVLLFSIAL